MRAMARLSHPHFGGAGNRPHAKEGDVHDGSYSKDVEQEALVAVLDSRGDVELLLLVTVVLRKRFVVQRGHGGLPE